MKSSKINMSLNILLILMAVYTVVLGTPRWVINGSPRNYKSNNIVGCVTLGKPCMKSTLPCCTLKYESNFQGLDKVPTTCFKFGKGVCEVNQSIKNYDEYSKLGEQINETNFEELKEKYWNLFPVKFTCPMNITVEMRSG